MATKLKLPDLGEGIDDADVLTVLVRNGQTVAKDDPIIEVESEKATLEVPAEAPGVITQILVSKGDTITVGQAILELEESDTTPDTTESDTTPDTTETNAAIGANEKAIPPTAAPLQVDDAADPDSDTVAPNIASTTLPAKQSDEASTTPVFAAPSVRQFAREIGVDIRRVRGSGPANRISIDDVKAHARTRSVPETVAPLTSTPLPDFSPFGEVTRERMNRVRRATATNITRSWSTIPHITLFDEADVTEVEALRKREKARVEASGVNLTITAILLKVVAAALKAHPRLNSSADFTTNELVLKRYYHLGVATETERGLFVPVLQNVDTKSILEIALELNEVTEQARGGRLPAQRLEGASFTISNLGGIGTGHFTPIVNPPEVGILGVGRSVERPVYIDGQLHPRLLLPLSLSLDHRSIDGADGARFLTWIVDALAQPLMLAMEN